MNIMVNKRSTPPISTKTSKSELFYYKDCSDLFFYLIIYTEKHRREELKVYSRRCNLYSFKIGLGSVASKIVITLSCIDKLICHHQ